MKKIAQRLFGFRQDDYPTNPGLDEYKLIETLARLSADVNWLKRGWWVLVAALVASQVVQ